MFNQTILKIFFLLFSESKSIDELIAALPFAQSTDPTADEKVIPIQNLTIEGALFWMSLVEYIQKKNDEDDRLEDVICDLSTFCDYVEK